MKLNVLKSGDHVLNVTCDFVAVERANGEVDILPFVKEGANLWIDAEHTLTIGYGENTVETEGASGVVITNF